MNTYDTPITGYGFSMDIGEVFLIRLFSLKHF